MTREEGANIPSRRYIPYFPEILQHAACRHIWPPLCCQKELLMKRPTSSERSSERPRGQRGQRAQRGNTSRDSSRSPYAKQGRRRPSGPAQPDRKQRYSRDRSRPVQHEDIVQARYVAVVEPEGIDQWEFSDLGLDPRIVSALSARGIQRPFPIQAATIPDAIAGRNILARAQTGSGKTLAYGAPLITRLQTLSPSKERGRDARALVLAPTRELAEQIDSVIQPLARTVGLHTIALYGGVPLRKQLIGLGRGVDIIIATPGRLEDLVERGRVDLAKIRITVVDEADHMCELGFREPLARILGQVDPRGQRLLYSATMDEEVANLVDRFVPEPVVHEAMSTEATGTIDHEVLLVDPRGKTDIVGEIARINPGRTVVFTRTRHGASELSDSLNDSGIPSTCLHGDLNQAQRRRNLAALTDGRVRVLVATDVAARGLDVDGVTLVVQADPPEDHKSYIHRAGRTGRAGSDGVVVTLSTERGRRRVSDMLRKAGVHAPMRQARVGDALPEDIVAMLSSHR